MVEGEVSARAVGKNGFATDLSVLAGASRRLSDAASQVSTSPPDAGMDAAHLAPSVIGHAGIASAVAEFAAVRAHVVASLAEDCNGMSSNLDRVRGRYVEVEQGIRHSFTSINAERGGNVEPQRRGVNDHDNKH